MLLNHAWQLLVHNVSSRPIHVHQPLLLLVGGLLELVAWLLGLVVADIPNAVGRVASLLHLT